MEKNADKLKDILEGRLILYRELQDIFEQEKPYITNLNVASLWKTTAQKQQVSSKLESLSLEIRHLLEKRAGELGMEGSTFTLSDYIKHLPSSKKVKAELARTQLALDACQKGISVLALGSKTYINDALAMMNDVFSLVVNSAATKEYTKSGHLLENTGRNGLFKAEV